MDAAKNVANSITTSATNAANYVSDKANEALSGASYDANKEVAKSGDAPVGDRLHAAGDAVGDKLDQNKSSASAEVNKQNV